MRIKFLNKDENEEQIVEEIKNRGPALIKYHNKPIITAETSHVLDDMMKIILIRNRKF